jgi:hypothetical protein
LDIGTECDYEDNFLIGNSGGGAGWSAMSVKLGLDEAVILEQLEKLTDHSHVYLTGRGRGHNKVQAETGPALLPDGTVGDDVDGVPNPDDRCPSTPPDQAVDADGCSLGEFCALHRSASSCVSADWNDDAQKNPKDCRWRRQVCEAR